MPEYLSAKVVKSLSDHSREQLEVAVAAVDRQVHASLEGLVKRLESIDKQNGNLSKDVAGLDARMDQVAPRVEAAISAIESAREVLSGTIASSSKSLAQQLQADVIRQRESLEKGLASLDNAIASKMGHVSEQQAKLTSRVTWAIALSAIAALTGLVGNLVWLLR